MRYYIFLTVVLLTISVPIFSQLELREYSKARAKCDIEMLKEKADNFYYENKIDSALICYQRIHDIATEYHDSLNICFALKEQGSMTEILGDYHKALQFLLQASEIAQRNSYFKLFAATEINIGIVYFNLRESEKSLKYYFSALETGKNIKDTIIQIKALNNMGNAYLTLLLDMNKAEECFNQSVELAGLCGYEQAVIVGMNNLCQIYMNSGRTKEAYNYTDKIIKLYPESPYIYYNLGNLYRQSGDEINAIQAFLKAIELSKYEV